jgi:CRP/FNR family transcriptional regulator, cyclic AMP receptor protein
MWRQFYAHALKEASMSASTTVMETCKSVDDILEHLPISGITECSKGEVVYSPSNPCARLYLVTAGAIGISRRAEDGRELLLEIAARDAIFGESAFLDPSRRAERACALERSSLMSWTGAEIEDLVTKRPRLAMSLLRIFAERSAALSCRLESHAFELVERRLARSLLGLSGQFGADDGEGSVKLIPITHETLARYVGTSREIVTGFMNRFRRQGHVSYSRRGILLNAGALHLVLQGRRFPSDGARD